MHSVSFFQWVPEITHHCPKTPFLLVGTQIDLRDDPSTIEKLAKNKQKPITPETAEKLARDLKAVKYVECSALTQVRAIACIALGSALLFSFLSGRTAKLHCCFGGEFSGRTHSNFPGSSKLQMAPSVLQTTSENLAN